MMKEFFFTLAANQGGPGCVQIQANDSEEARQIMFKAWGNNWAFQYDALQDIHPNDRRIIVKIKGIAKPKCILSDTQIMNIYAETGTPIEFARAIIKATDGTRPAQA